MLAISKCQKGNCTMDNFNCIYDAKGDPSHRCKARCRRRSKLCLQSSSATRSGARCA